MRYTAPLLMILAGAVQAADQHTPYAGLEARAISTLSDSDIEALETGQGWGLALPAELNGYPGPRHVLELSDELGLSAEQVNAVRAIFEDMRIKAIAAGKIYVEAERALDHGFQTGGLTKAALSKLVAEAEAVRGTLRQVHLAKHLEMVAILTQEQVDRYNVLRGYAEDPCAHVLDGHDAEMWRRHNGCDG